MEKNTIIFDGECNLCNGVVGWLLRNTEIEKFNFVPFQSCYGQKLLQEHGFQTDRLETVVLLDEQGIHVLSDGFLRIIAKLPEWKFVSRTLALVPKFVRDTIYKLAAKNRVLLFGKSQFCTLSLS